MSTLTYTNLVYFFGPDTTDLSPDTRINIKIGLSGNNQINFEQRLGEHQRHCPGDIAHAHFPTNGGDAAVRKYMCATHPKLFGTNRGKGREVISLLVKDIPFLLEQAARWFNALNAGTSINKGKLLSFPLRCEQEECLRKTIAFYSNDANNGREFLWDCKMRFGKTHVAYELVMRMDFGLILILTGRPTDTKRAWIEAMDHIDFDFGIDNFIDASKQGDTPIVVDPNKRTIIFASLQDYARMVEEGIKEKFKNFPTFTFDLIIKDEYHLSFDTSNTKEAISKLQYKYVLNLSGTPFRALLEERFDDDAKFTWSYISEQHARKCEIEKLGQEQAEKNGQYYWLCPMKIFTILLSTELYKDVDLFTEDEGFTFTKLFSVENNSEKPTFRNEIQVKSFINTLSHGRIMPYSDQVQHMYTSINMKHTLWYVPGVNEAKALAAMLKKHEIFKRYDIIIAAGDNSNEGNNTVELVTTRITDIENGRNKKHIGTITLSCGKLSHGVSIKEWGSVINLSDMSSAQLYFQFIFRGQTRWDGMKDKCYVFDFNPNRTLTHVHTLATATAKTKEIKPILTELLDVFNVQCYEGTEFKQVDAQELLEKLEAGFGRSTSLAGLQTQFEDLSNIIELDDELIDALGDIEGGTSKTKILNVSENDTPNGKNRKRSQNDNNSDDEDELEKDDSDCEQEKDKEQLSEDQKTIRLKEALRSVPLYFLFTGDMSFDNLVNSLDAEQNRAICKIITGLLARSLKKALVSIPQERKQRLSNSIDRFRTLEEKDHKDFQEKLKLYHGDKIIIDKRKICDILDHTEILAGLHRK